MPPKFKFSKEKITQTALDIVRKDGAQALTARSLALALGSSAKPIFGYFQSMDELWKEVMGFAHELYMSFLAEDIKKGEYPPYKASGMAYIRFAKEEKELFKLLFMRDRSGERIAEDREEIRPLLDIIMNTLGIDEDKVYLFHLEMWVYIHGIATMIATSYLNWDTEFISKSVSDVYMGLKMRYTEMEE